MVEVLCIRTEMIGGGTSYDVLWPKDAKPSYPLHGSIYATTVITGARHRDHAGDRDAHALTW
jgi:hypothetical protein